MEKSPSCVILCILIFSKMSQNNETIKPYLRSQKVHNSACHTLTHTFLFALHLAVNPVYVWTIFQQADGPQNVSICGIYLLSRIYWAPKMSSQIYSDSHFMTALIKDVNNMKTRRIQCCFCWLEKHWFYLLLLQSDPSVLPFCKINWRAGQMSAGFTRSVFAMLGATGYSEQWG